MTSMKLLYTASGLALLALTASVHADPNSIAKPTASISGTVVYETTRKPAAGVEVGAFKDNGQTGDITTDGLGHYTIPSLAPGSYVVGIAPGQSSFKDWTSSADSISVTDGEKTTGVVVTLTHGSTVTGKITDKITGKSVPDFQILATVQSKNLYIFGSTGPDGIYCIHVLPGNYDLQPEVFPASNNPNFVQHFHAVKDAIETFNFQVSTPIVVRGIVVGPDGKPVPRASVSTSMSIQGPQNSTSFSQNSYSTDAQGRFVFKTPNSQQVTSLTAVRGDLATASPTLSTGADDVTLHLVQTPKFVATGRVMDSSGQPVPNAYVILISQQGNFGMSVANAHTDANGRYTFQPTTGNMQYAISAQPAGYSIASSAKLDLTAGPTIQVPDLIVTATNSVLGGTLVDIKGNPIANADISDNGHPDAKVTTDQNGHFLLKAMRTGMVDLIIHTQDGRWINYSIESGNPNSIVTMPAPVNGIVLDPDGKPVPGAKITTEVDPVGTQTFIADSAGRFTIDSPGLKPKTPILARSLTLATTWPVIYNGEDKVILHLVSGNLCSFAGKIIDSNGAPAPGVTVSLTRWAKDIGGQMDEVKTDSNGQYSFDPIYGNSKYIISASGKGYGQAASEAILAGTSQSLQVPLLTLPIADSFAAGTVVDAKGMPIAGASVTDQDITSPIIGATTDQAGHFILKNVPRGKTQVYATSADGSWAEQYLTTGRGDSIIYLQKPAVQK